MRVIVPLQGVVQGRGGLILGSILPCTLFFLLQLYLKRNRRPPSDPTPPSSDSHFNQSTSALEPVQVSLRAESIANPTPSAYYLGWSKYLEDPYNKLTNPSGIIQLGLAENRLSFDLIEKWMNDNLESVMLNGDSKIDDMFLYQPSDGMLEMKKVCNFITPLEWLYYMVKELFTISVVFVLISLISFMRFNFVYCLLLMHEVMMITEFLSQAFQKKEIDILNAIQFLSLTKRKLQTMRDGGWDSLIMKIETFCLEHGISMPDMSAPYKKGARDNERNITNEHYFRVNILYAVIDLQLMELEKRFPETSMELLGLSASFDPRHGFQAFKAEDVCKLASKFYPCDFTSCDMDNLKMECGFFLDGIEQD